MLFSAHGLRVVISDQIFLRLMSPSTLRQSSNRSLPLFSLQIFKRILALAIAAG